MAKTVFVTIAGRANAGKSSLLNALIGEKIASVSSKPQTTRTKITGILNHGETQLIFIDTPGLHKAKNKLSEHMLNTVKESVTDIDAVIFMSDCTQKPNEQEIQWLKSLQASKTPVIFVLNKIDLLPDKSALAKKLMEVNAEFPDLKAIVPVSVLEDDVTDIILE